MNSKLKEDQNYYRRTRKWPSVFSIKSHSRVLDIGCGVGLLGIYLKEKYQAHVTGVEIIEENCAEASKFLDSVICCDLVKIDPEKIIHKFDIIIFSDSLEHMIDPKMVLNLIKPLFSKSGKLLISLPNIRNFRVTIPLIFGDDWRYKEEGLLDYTHLRFFSEKSIRRLLEECGYSINHVFVDLPFNTKVGILNILTFGFLKRHLTSHYFIEACLKR